MKLENLMTFDQAVKAHPEKLTKNRLKHMMRNRKQNGLEDAFYIVAGQGLVDIPALEKGIAKRNAD